MTEEAKTTEPEEQGTPAAENGSGNPETKATQPEPKSIFDGFTAEERSYLEKKGWNEENYVRQSLNSYRNLEKMMGGSKDIVEFPKEGDAEGTKALLKRLGAPESAESYQYDTGEHKEYDKLVGVMKELALKSNLTNNQFNTFMGAWLEKDRELSEVNQKTFIDEKKRLLNEYASEHGKEFATIKDSTDRALRMYNITDEERVGLENGIGIKRFYDLFGTIGKHMEEGKLVTKANDPVTNTVETYQMELDKLFADVEFMNRYTMGDASARAKIEELNKKIAGGR